MEPKTVYALLPKELYSFLSEIDNILIINKLYEPTEESLQKYQRKLTTMVKKLQEKYPPKPVPVIYKSLVSTLGDISRMEKRGLSNA